MLETKEANKNEQCNPVNTPVGDSNKNNSLSYKKDLWMYFDSIKDKFYFDRTKAKTLLYIISQKTDLEYEYSQSLKYLYDQFTNQFEHHINQNNTNNIYIEYTLNLAINNLINNLKYESELYSNHSKDILDSIIKPLESFIMSQCEITYELNDLMESYEKEFKIVNQMVEQKQINFHQEVKTLENVMNKLEIIKNKYSNANDNSFNYNENIFNIDEGDKEMEMIEKLSQTLEKNKTSAKAIQADYVEYINKANHEREKYIRESEHIYDKIQNLDEEFINMMKNQINFLIEKELNLIESIKKRKISLIEYTNQINIEKDIKNFINSKLTKFNHPKPFEYVDYNPDKFLRSRKGHNETIQHEICLKIIESLKTIFKYEKPTTNEIEEENINFINETVNDIWEQNSYNKKKLELLFKEHIYRFRFLRMLNQYRVEGIFILENISFQNFCMTLSSLLDNAIKDDDYECIKLCMILSQTFYLQGEKRIILQSGITLNSIWQSKDFWDKMIEYSINEEVNNTKGYLIFLDEDHKSREKRVESAIISNLITYSFNMKLFGYPEKEAKIIIDQFIEKYKIDGSMIYASNVSIKDIKDDIIVESVDNIIKNEIKDANENDNIKRNNNNTINSDNNSNKDKSLNSENKIGKNDNA